MLTELNTIFGVKKQMKQKTAVKENVQVDACVEKWIHVRTLVATKGSRQNVIDILVFWSLDDTYEINEGNVSDLLHPLMTNVKPLKCT